MVRIWSAGTVAPALGGGWGCDVRSLCSARAVRSRLCRCAGNRQRGPVYPPGERAEARTRGQSQRPPALRRACLARRSGLPVHVRAKGVLRTAGSKRLFRPFLSAQKGARAGARNSPTKSVDFAGTPQNFLSAGGVNPPCGKVLAAPKRLVAGLPAKASALANAKTPPSLKLPTHERTPCRSP